MIYATKSVGEGISMDHRDRIFCVRFIKDDVYIFLWLAKLSINVTIFLVRDHLEESRKYVYLKPSFRCRGFRCLIGSGYVMTKTNWLVRAVAKLT